MAEGGRDSSFIRAPLGVALDSETRRIDLLVARIWQVFGVLAVAFGLIAAVTVSRALGLWTAGFSAILLIWFTIARALLIQARGGSALAFATTLVESSLPWVALLLLVEVQGAAYALGSWLPPMLFGALIMTSTVRLRPLVPLILGISSGVAFLVLYWLAVKSALPPGLANTPLYRAGTQVTRAVSLGLGGALGMLVSQGLRAVIGRAESAARAQDLFGKYRLSRQIAAGGMGTVHEAVYCPEGGFERLVAVKRIHPHLAEQVKFVNEFRTEAELSARLVHANIVQVFDFGRVDETYFLAMEYIDGLTLYSFMRRVQAAKRPIPDWLVAHIGREVLAGLAFSHTGARAPDGKPLRIIHRDMSPSNVLLSRNGEVKISDFGLARALRDADSARTQTLAGHVAYMAPEQAMGLPFDERCDLFGLGVIMWELLASERLFLRGAEATTLFALVSDEIPSIRSRVPDLDPAWEAFMKKAIAREPDQRFGSAREMSNALDGFQSPTSMRVNEELARWVEEVLELPETRKEDDALTERVDSATFQASAN